MQAITENTYTNFVPVSDFPVNKALSDFAVELCGDCLWPAKWSQRLSRWTCDRCGA